MDAAGIDRFAVGQYDDVFAVAAAFGDAVITARYLAVEYGRAAQILVGGHFNRLDFGIDLFVGCCDGDDIGRALFQVVCGDFPGLCDGGALGENLLGSRDDCTRYLFDAEVGGLFSVGQPYGEGEHRYAGGSGCQCHHGRRRSGCHHDAVDFRVDPGVGDGRRNDIRGGGLQVFDKDVARLCDGFAVAQDLLGRGKGQPLCLFEADIGCGFAVGQGGVERKGRCGGLARCQDDRGMYAGCRRGVFDGVDLAADIAFLGDGGEAVGRIGFEVADLDDARCGYGFSVGEDLLGRGDGFGGLGADVAAFVRILEREREFQRVECGVADGDRNGRVRISPPPRFCRRMSLADRSTAPTVPFPMTGKI